MPSPYHLGCHRTLPVRAVVSTHSQSSAPGPEHTLTALPSPPSKLENRICFQSWDKTEIYADCINDKNVHNLLNGKVMWHLTVLNTPKRIFWGLCFRFDPPLPNSLFVHPSWFLYCSWTILNPHSAEGINVELLLWRVQLSTRACAMPVLCTKPTVVTVEPTLVNPQTRKLGGIREPRLSQKPNTSGSHLVYLSIF